jgi:hypothetical protein
MPNGFMGSKAEWDRLEAPLVALDGAFDEFATRHGSAMERNYHAWPSRLFRWRRDDGIDRCVEVFLESEAALAFAVCGAAYTERVGARFVRQLRGADLLSAPLDLTRVQGALEDVYRSVDALSLEDLERVQLSWLNRLSEALARWTIGRRPV